MKQTISPRAQQILEFLARNGFQDAELSPLAGDASFRRYVRVRKGDKHAMLMDAPPEKENSRSYLSVATYLCERGYSAPRVFAHEAQNGLLLIEDLGDALFSQEMRQHPACERELYSAAIDMLVEWHDKMLAFSDRVALPLPAYDHKLLTQEVNLFTNWFFPQIVGKEKAAALSAEYLDIWKRILSGASLDTTYFIHRDYHADNLMWLPKREGLKRVGLLDFQDAVYGDAAYDLVSLLEDARRDVPAELAAAMLSRYITNAGVNRDAFMSAYAILGAQRNSKIVGIFSRLAARDNKHHYLDFLPRVWRYLEQDVAHPALAELRQWLNTHVPMADRGVITIQHDSRDLALSA